MNFLKKLLNFFAWLITSLFQVIVGMVLATLAVGLTQGQMPISLIIAALGLLVGVYAAGAVIIALRKSIQSKRYFLRLVLSFVGVFIPYAYMIYSGSIIGYDNPRFSEGLGLLMTILAALLGVIGFSLPGWFGRKKKDEAVG